MEDQDLKKGLATTLLSHATHRVSDLCHPTVSMIASREPLAQKPGKMILNAIDFYIYDKKKETLIPPCKPSDHSPNAGRY